MIRRNNPKNFNQKEKLKNKVFFKINNQNENWFTKNEFFGFLRLFFIKYINFHFY